MSSKLQQASLTKLLEYLDAPFAVSQKHARNKLSHQESPHQHSARTPTKSAEENNKDSFYDNSLMYGISSQQALIDLGKETNLIFASTREESTTPSCRGEGPFNARRAEPATKKKAKNADSLTSGMQDAADKMLSVSMPRMKLIFTSVERRFTHNSTPVGYHNSSPQEAIRLGITELPEKTGAPALATWTFAYLERLARPSEAIMRNSLHFFGHITRKSSAHLVQAVWGCF
ncbi:hypothetical protein RB195_026514 [Necator americanus]|uniref:Uncharacterized protein n=1 Tax=Necator americanus TaxID=51031 RepID=A0ABR1EXA5_NECAM